MEEQDLEYEYEEQSYNVYNLLKWAASILGFLGVMGLFVWVTVPAPRDELLPLVRVSTLPHDRQLSPGSSNRIVLVGDVHGMHKELKKLLKMTEFNHKTDQLVLLGDFISKGPNSIAVIEEAMRLGAACVRGNHEDDLLDLYARVRGIHDPLTYPPDALVEPATFGSPVTATLEPTKGLEWDQPLPTGEVGELGEDEDEELGGLSSRSYALTDEARDKTLAMHFEPRHINYLEACPAILKLGQVKTNGGHGIAVHGGLMWNEPDLELQRPEVIFRLRSLVPPDFEDPSDDMGAPWARIYNQNEKKKEPRDALTVFYGHDAGRGLKLRKYTKGIDSKCVRGGKLSAMVLSMTKHGKVRAQLVQVKCRTMYESGALVEGEDELEFEVEDVEYDNYEELPFDDLYR